MKLQASSGSTSRAVSWNGSIVLSTERHMRSRSRPDVEPASSISPMSPEELIALSLVSTIDCWRDDATRARRQTSYRHGGPKGRQLYVTGRLTRGDLRLVRGDLPLVRGDLPLVRRKLTFRRKVGQKAAGLPLPKMRVEAFGRNQLVVRALLDNAALVHDHQP